MNKDIAIPNHSNSDKRASALLIVLWAVAIMAMTVLGVVEYVHYDVGETASLERNLRLRQIAYAGMAIGVHPAIKRGDSLLNQTIGPGESFQVHLRSEGGRLNINTIVQGARWDILEELFVGWGIKRTDAVNISNAFQFWTKEDKWQQVTTAKVTGMDQSMALSQQPGTPPVPVHRFASVDEMHWIPGMDLVEALKPDWRDSFTIWSDGPLDINEAPLDLIKAVCGVGDLQAQRIFKYRLGPDGKPDTDDDKLFQNMDEVRQLLGMSKPQFEQIQALISLQDNATRVESIATLMDRHLKITTVVRRAAAPPTYLLWDEP